MWTVLRRFGSLYAVPRSSRYARVGPEDIAFFRSVLSATGVQTEDLEKFGVDWMGIYRGSPSAVLKPTATAQVSAVLRYCSDRHIAVCPQGGNTGLVGGSVPVHDEVVLSLTAMNKVIKVDELQACAVCEAGVVLEELNNQCVKKGLIVPLDLGAKGSCCIGGNVSTNAGGLRYLRYGSLHGNILGLEVVLPNGDVLDSLHSMRKDNTGYDLKQLFIGSEGTLGVVTKVAIQLAQKPKAVNAVFFSCSSFETVVELLRRARSDLSEILSAYEFLDDGAMDLVLKHLPAAKYPFEKRQPFYILIETHGSNQEHDQEKLSDFLEGTLQHFPDMQGVVTQDEKQLAAVWTLREGCVEAAAKEGYCFFYDLGLPLSHYYALVEATRTKVGSKGKTVSYGHVADCNVHLNVSVADKGLVGEVQRLLEPFVYEFTTAAKGSISAEHGIGLQKQGKMQGIKTPAQIQTMSRLKHLFDPNGILSPYKLMWQ